MQVRILSLQQERAQRAYTCAAIALVADVVSTAGAPYKARGRLARTLLTLYRLSCGVPRCPVIEAARGGLTAS